MPNNEYFQSNPTRLDVSRSKLSLKPRWTGTWSTGRLVPIFATSLIMPGDTVSMDVSAAIRSITPIFPVMDDADITVEAFFVPHRLILSRKSMSPDVNDSNHSWAAFLGAQDSLLNMPTPGDVYLPKFHVGTYSNGTLDMYKVGGLADCLGFAKPQTTSVVSYDVNCLKPLAYYSIWNEYFRDPNTMSPVTYNISSQDYVELVGTDANIGYSSYGHYHLQQIPLAPVCRYHGYFGSALPWPQRNSNQVQIPLGTVAPVITTNTAIPMGTHAYSLRLGAVGSPDASEGYGTFHLADTVDRLVGMEGGSVFAKTTVLGSGSFGNGAVPINLWADLSTATAATVNQFRSIVQVQRWYEALARGGNKLEDMTYSLFGVRGPEVATRPEYLGGVRIPVSISQVASTATTGASGVLSPGNIGSTGAFSLTNMNNFLFTKSFTEHGTLMVVACVRVHDSFGQGISREDTKFERFQYYFPQFANLGEQATLGKELFVTGTASNDDAVFGYQEAWAEYRMIPDQVTGRCRPGQNLDMITYANNFLSLPTLKGFLDASSQVDNVDKTIQVLDSTAGFQWFGQFQFNITMTRPMPLYSIPGLVDHH